MHPTHIPLKREAKAAGARIAGDPRPRSRFLGHRDHAGEFAVHHVVGVTQQLHRFEVLIAAVDIRRPLAFLARVIEVQHRRHRVHAQAVHVKHIAPKARVGGDEILNLGSAVIKHRRTPIRMLAALGIRMLKKRRAIETHQRPVVLRKMRGHPIDEHANARLVQSVDEKLKILRRTVATARRVKSRNLISP